jgi:hypothetical protein
MSVILRDDIVHLEHPCRVEDAEPLFGLLQGNPERAVDLAKAGHLHTAIVQVLLLFRPKISGSAEEVFTRRYIEPLLMPKYQDTNST